MNATQTVDQRPAQSRRDRPREIRVHLGPDRAIEISWYEADPNTRLAHIEHGGAAQAGDFVRMLLEKAGAR